jgi:hypothetical protein
MTSQYPWHPWTTDLALKEDGQRVNLTDKTFEWWYFDTIMEDGSTCVVNFLSKPPFLSGPTQPILQFNISPPTGPYIQKVLSADASTYSAASDRCAVTIGESSVEGDLHTYRIRAKADDIEADLTLRRVVPGWRQGPFLTPDEAATLWLGEQIVIPSGTVEGTLTYNGATRKVRGTCYHDHQWGGAGAPQSGQSGAKLTSWYWARIQAGDHAVVMAQIYGTVDNGPVMPVMNLWMLARGSAITFDDTVGALTVTPKGGTPKVPGSLDITWSPNAAPGTPPPLGTVRFSLSSAQEIANFTEGRYLRFVCPVTMTSDFAGENFSEKGSAVWEIMRLD